jgi:MFS family permease
MLVSRCAFGLNTLNLFVAAAQTGFGPFLSVYLIEQGWNTADIGFALSIGTVSVLVLQLPSGALVDLIHQKRFANLIGLVLLGFSAWIMLAVPTQGPVLTAQIMHSVASCILTPAIAALTLVLCGQARFSEQLGVNARYASIGNALTAGLLGLLASYVSNRAVFVATTLLVLPAIAVLPLFRNSDRVPADDHPAVLHPTERLRRQHRPWHIFDEPAFVVFVISAVLFQFSNAAMLQLALSELAKRSGRAGLVVSAAIIVPQIVVAVFSPLVGRLAQSLGRRPILLVGFLALPVRGLLFMTLPDAVPLVVIQVLDGISGAVFGLMVPLIAADVTRRSGFLNFGINSLSLAGGLGATFSTTAAGWVAYTLGAPMAFFGLALVGLAALLLIWFLLPETRSGKPITGAPQPVPA